MKNIVHEGDDVVKIVLLARFEDNRTVKDSLIGKAWLSIAKHGSAVHTGRVRLESHLIAFITMIKV